MVAAALATRLSSYRQRHSQLELGLLFLLCLFYVPLMSAYAYQEGVSLVPAKAHAMPCHHNLETYLTAYIEGAGIAEDPKGPLFRTIGRGTGLLTRTPLPQANAYAMIGRRAAATGIATKLGNHSFRATGITAYLENGGTLEKAAQMANHASTRTTQLYDRRREELSLDEVERIMV
jgi:Phage integrase family